MCSRTSGIGRKAQDGVPLARARRAGIIIDINNVKITYHNNNNNNNNNDNINNINSIDNKNNMMSFGRERKDLRKGRH